MTRRAEANLDRQVTASNSAPVVFRSQMLPIPGATDVTAIAQRRVLHAFLQTHPNYDIKPFVMPAVLGSSLDTGPLMAIAAGVAPNAIYVNFRQSSTFVEHGFLIPVEVLLARLKSHNPAERATNARDEWRANPTPAEIKRALKLIRQRVVAAAWPVIYREGPNGERHVWAMPTSTLVMALLYRKDLFNAAGLDPADPPKTWSQLLADARRLTIPSEQQVGMSMSGGEIISWGTYTFLVSSGARAVQRDKNGKWRATYDTENAAKAYYFLWKLVHGKFARNGKIFHGAARIYSAGSANQFRDWDLGRIGMRFAYLNQQMIQDLNPQLVGIAPVPVSSMGTRGSELNAQMLGIFADSPPRIQLAVMRYIWYITGEAAQRLRVKTFIEQGFGQFVSPALLKKFGYDRLLRQVPKGWAQTFDTAIEHGVPEPYGHNTENIYRFMSEPINTILGNPNVGSMPKAQALAYIRGLLKKSVQTVNDQVLGNVPAKVMQFRRVIAAIAVLVVGLIFFFGLSRIWRHFTQVSAAVSENRSWRRFLWGYVLLLPAFGLVMMWAYLPLFGGLGMAFMDYELVRQSAFVGLTNFANVLFDTSFWMAMWRTVYFVALVIGLGFWPPILLGILLQEVPTEPLKYFFRTVYYLPAIVSGVIMMFLWAQLYNPTKYGTLNQILLSANLLGPIAATLVKWVLLGMWLSLIALMLWLPYKLDEMTWPFKLALWAVALVFLGVTVTPVIEAMVGATSLGAAAAGGAGVLAHLVGPFHLQALGWSHSPRMAMLCVVIPIVWATAGPGSILYLAALKTVADDLYEAADIDGAGTWHKVFYITLPRLKFLIVIQFIAAVIAAFKGGTNYILALTGGGPNHATMILAVKIFFTTFLELRFGLGTAMAWILGAMLIWFTANQLKMLARAEFKSGANR